MQLTKELYQEYATLKMLQKSTQERLDELKDQIIAELPDTGASVETPAGKFSTRKYYSYDFPEWVEAKRSELKEAEMTAKQTGEAAEKVTMSLVFTQ